MPRLPRADILSVIELKSVSHRLLRAYRSFWSPFQVDSPLTMEAAAFSPALGVGRHVMTVLFMGLSVTVMIWALSGSCSVLLAVAQWRGCTFCQVVLYEPQVDSRTNADRFGFMLCVTPQLVDFASFPLSSLSLFVCLFLFISFVIEFEVYLAKELSLCSQAYLWI